MGDTTPAAGRAAWLRRLRRENEDQEDALAPDYDALWGRIEDTHRAFIERFLSTLPPEGRVLDAACGTGKYFGMVLESGRSLLGVDHTRGYLAKAGEKFPGVPTQKHDLQDLPYEDAFDGVMCVDAMEFVPPEDWPGVLTRFRRALHQGGGLYLTVELAREQDVRAANAEARTSGLPVVDGEVMWEEPDGYYHHYPSMEQVRTWVADAGFAIEEDAEGPWHLEGYAYHHLLARGGSLPT
ncbi:MAG TPA: methyltransferase domain-containing protein [Actinomycetota bacterium]